MSLAPQIVLSMVCVSALLALPASFVARSYASQVQSRSRVPTAGEEVVVWADEHYDAVLAYQRGELATALESVRTRTLEEQRRIVQHVLAVLEVRARTAATPLGAIDASKRYPDRSRPPQVQKGDFRWTIAATKAAGALHMEAALAAYARAGAAAARDIGEQVRFGEGYFNFFAKQSGEPSQAPGWELALGLRAVADGRFGLAETILSDARARFGGDAALDLAYGSVQETLAMFPANAFPDAALNGTTERNPLDDSEPSRFRGSVNALGAARSARQRHLGDAQRALERSAALDPRQPETRLRLAQVLSMQGRTDRATELLDGVIQDSRTKDTQRYIALLVRGRMRLEAKDVVGARGSFDAARALIPDAQSAQIAFANAARVERDNGTWSDVVRVTLLRSGSVSDPWTAYRFGQYWQAAPLLEQLRREARQ